MSVTQRACVFLIVATTAVLSGCEDEAFEPEPIDPMVVAVDIVTPVQSIECPGTAACSFGVEGTSSNVWENADLRIYVFVFPREPPGAGWYPQVLPATVSRDGEWLQTPAWLGNEENPAKSGDTFRIVAVVVHKDAAGNGIMLRNWPAGGSILSYDDFLPREAVSRIVELRIN